MFSPVASAIFTIRNIDKTENGEIGRAPVALGQAVGVLGEISKYDNAIAVSAKNVLSVFSDLSKENRFMNYAGKFAKFASDNVNPLIALSGGVKVLMSDDKQSTAITEAAALSTMFGGEALVKKHYDKILNSTVIQNGLKKAASTKYLKPIFEFIESKKWGGATGAVIKGLLFFAGSMTSYEVGHAIGKKTAKYIKDKQNASSTQNLNLEEIYKNAMGETPQVIPQKINHIA